MKIHIVLNFESKLLGGTYQFSKALRSYFINKGVYTDNPDKADVYLFNAYLEYKKIISLKKKYPNKCFIQRMDGPISLYSSNIDKRDLLVYILNKYIADGTIFQSNYSFLENKKNGLKMITDYLIIINAPDAKYFNKIGKNKFTVNNKIKLVASSWSKHWKKGFSTYQWIDNNLDFSVFEMTFIGQTPLKFKNIIHIKPLMKEQLSQEIKKHDIFITASQNDSCSNALIEAMHCGLPSIGLNSGGHPEIIGDGGGIFSKDDEIVPLLYLIANNYSSYQNNIKLPKINHVAEKYLEYLKEKHLQKKSKQLNYLSIFKLYLTYYKYKAFRIILKFI